MVVFSPSGGEYRALAEAIADDRGEPLVEEFSGLDGRTDPVVYVDDPDGMTEETAFALQERLLSLGPRDGGFGIVTGFTPDHAEELYFESSEYGDGHTILLRKLHEDWYSYDDETTILTEERASVPELREASEAGLESLTLFSSGWAIHLYLSGGYVCGIPNSVDPSQFDGLNPTCVRDGDGECPLDGDLVRAEELNASHVFLNSCAPLLNNGVVDLPVHVGLSLLSGADTLIGSYRLTSFTHEEAILHYALLRAGYGLSERCYLLNRNAHKLGMKSHPYVGFGPPRGASDAAVAPQYEVDIADATDGVDVVVSDFAGHVVDLEIDADRVGSADEYFVRNLVDSLADAPLYYTAFEDGDAVRVLIYSLGYFEAEELRFRLSPAQHRDLDKRVVLDSAGQATALERFGLTDNKVSGQISDLENKLGGLPEYLYNERLDANAFRETDGRLDQLLDSVDRIHRRVTDWLGGRGYAFLFADHKPNAIPTDVYRSDRRCSVCDKHVFVRVLTDTSGQFARALGTCPRCGYIFDVPTDPASRGRLPVPEFRTDLMEAGEGPEQFRVAFENPRDVPMRAEAYPWLKSERDEYHGARLFDPDRVSTVLEPGETTEFEFEIDVPALDETENVRENKYHVFVFVVGNLNIYTGSARLFVGGREEYPFYYE